MPSRKCISTATGTSSMRRAWRARPKWRASASGASNSETGALDSFVERRGVCRDYAHVMIALARSAHIPARMASVYALRVAPQDFHAVAEVYLDGDWHMVDATGMTRPAETARPCDVFPRAKRNRAIRLHRGGALPFG